MSLTAADIARRVGGAIVQGSDAATVTSWSCDSRTLVPGACFVALRGSRDGHDFVGDAFHAGASVALVQRVPHSVEPRPDQAFVVVADVVAALQAVARAVRSERSHLRVVGVAGSTGKTSTKDLLGAALRPLGAYANVDSFNNEFGVPVTLLNTPAAAPILVAELGERFPGDVATLCEVAQPEIGIVTNVGLAHAEHLTDYDGVVAVLAELMEALPESGLAVLNADDDHTPKLAGRTAARVVTVGRSLDADYRVSAVMLDDRVRASFDLGETRISLSLHGAHQVSNAALAAVVAHEGFARDWDEIASSIANAPGARWRMEIRERADGVVVLNDSYNASPASMSAALHTLANVDVPGRRIAVLGDMRELGTHTDSAHSEVGRQAGDLAIDVVVGVGAGGARIADAAAGRVDVARVVEDAEGAVRELIEIVRPGDAVLVKASRALGLQVVATRLLTREATTP
ncbi:MAG: UDP-N-acetylmuramoyl-tripeptide--D-alanyl-D-alanine ligase [Actinomycetota bacterium]